MAKNDGHESESFTESLKQLGSDISILIREDLESARAEMLQKAKDAGLGAGMLSGSAVAGLFALLCLTMLTIVLLASSLQLWLAVLIVTIVWACVAAILAIAGKRKMGDVGTPLPERTINKVKADLRSAKRQVRSTNGDA
ncbi:MAG TPA: phage holin family protein [Candidatus Eremiobacteraceae bacterium]|nr:phage holin family protein [Candidatus Eremiobacteraceae bacterium]